MKHLKRLVMYCFLMVVFSCNQTNHLISLDKEESLNFSLDNVSEELEDDIIVSYEELILNSSEEKFNKFKIKLKEKYGIQDNLTYQSFVSMKNTLFTQSKNKRIKSNNLFTDETVIIIEQIRDILNESVDEKSFNINFLKCKEVLIEAKNVKDDEKKFLLLKLKLIKKKAEKESKNARIAGINEVYKCKWWQWGCVFYTATVQLPVLSVWCIAQCTEMLWIIIQSNGMDYIAACCPGFCGCDNCIYGCPTYF